MKRVLKRVFQRSEPKAADDLVLDDAEVNDTDASSSVDSDSSTTVSSTKPRAPGSQPPEACKSAPNFSGAAATAPLAPNNFQEVNPFYMAAPAAVMADPYQQQQQQQQQQPQQAQQQQQPPQQQQPTQSLQLPPRDHVAPKSYESVTIAVGRNCPQGLRRAVWHVTDFDLRKLMYNGAISMVYHAVDKRSGITVALKLYKRIKLNEIERHQVAREIRLHSDLAHDSIIALYAAWKDKAYVYLALEWAPGGDVYSYLKSQRGRLAEELAVPLILEPFMAGLAVIHDKGLIHRDIKPENMLLTNSFQVKIADFGLSIDSKQEIANTRLGTIDYLAPEILDCPVKQHPEDHKDRPDTGYTNKVDCWSVGVLAYELLVGQPPFAAPTAQETLRLIRTKRVEYPTWLSAESVNFMSIVLVRDPTLRPSIAELLDHPWILKYSRREGGGLARARNRLQQRRPTIDGGVLVRSMTGELGSQQLAQKHQQFMQQQQQSQQLLQQQHQQQLLQQQQQAAAQGQVSGHCMVPGPIPAPHGGGAGGPQVGGGAVLPAVDGGGSIGGAGVAAAGGVPHPKQALHHSSTYSHGYQKHGQGLPLSMPLAQLQTPFGTDPSTMAASMAHGPPMPLPGAGGGVGGVGVPNFASQSTPAYDMSGAGGSGMMPAPGTSALTQGSSPMGALAPLQPPAQPPAGSLLPPATGARALASPDKSFGSFSRKLKFWSVSPNGGAGAPNGGSSSSGGGGGGGGSNGGAVAAPLAADVAAAAAAAAAWDAPMSGSSSPGSNTTGRVVPLPSPIPTGGNASPSLFARLTSGRAKSSAGASPQAPPASPPAGAMALLAGLMPGSAAKGGAGVAGGPDAMIIDSGVGAVGGATAAVPPVTPDAPTSPMNPMFRSPKMGGMAPGGGGGGGGGGGR